MYCIDMSSLSVHMLSEAAPFQEDHLDIRTILLKVPPESQDGSIEKEYVGRECKKPYHPSVLNMGYLITKVLARKMTFRRSKFSPDSISGKTNRNYRKKQRENKIQVQKLSEITVEASIECESKTTFDNLNGMTNSEAKPGTNSKNVCKDRSKDKAETDAIVFNGFTILKVVGKGAFGKVFLAKDSQGCSKCVKILDKSKVMNHPHLERTIAERLVLKSHGSHPFILSYVCSFQDSRRLFIVTEFCPGGDLFFHLQRYNYFNEKMVMFYSAEIVVGLAFLHEQSIVYRDLKPENILLDCMGHIRLADFGLVKAEVDEFSGAKSLCGTPAFIAPEMLLAHISNSRAGDNKTTYGYAVDWWSLGNVIFDMVFGIPAFLDDDTTIMYKKILYQELSFPEKAGNNTIVSNELNDLMSALMRKDPRKRLGSSSNGGVLAIENHPFFKIIDWQKLKNKRYKPPIIPMLKINEVIKAEKKNMNVWTRLKSRSKQSRKWKKIGPVAIDYCHSESALLQFFDKKFTNITPSECLAEISTVKGKGKASRFVSNYPSLEQWDDM